MSRWTEQFENHAFRTTWGSLIDTLDSSTVDDKTVVTSVSELARLNKVIEYIDGMLNGIDPDLVPLNTWDNFNNQATSCLQHVTNYNSNRNIDHINQANVHADNLLTYIRPYMVAHGKIGNALQASIKKYAKTIDEYTASFREKATGLVDEIENYRGRSEEIFGVIGNIKNTIDGFNAELFGEDEAAGVQEKIRDLVEELDEKYEKIQGYYSKILVGDEDEPSTKIEISQAKESILEEQDKIQELLESVSSEVKELEKFHVKVFGKQEEDNEKVGGLAYNLDNLIQGLKDFESVQKDKYVALNDEINSLLPGATSAGLATAYKDMKDSFDIPIRNATRLFYGAIGLLVLASIILAVDKVGGNSWVTFIKLQDWSLVLKGLVYKIPFYAPVLWLAFYATKRRSEHHRLQQEYAHKEALAKSYNSYKKQIEDLEVKDSDMLKEFIMKAIDAIAYNASESLDGKHGDKMPAQELIEKLVTELTKSHGSSA